MFRNDRAIVTVLALGLMLVGTAAADQPAINLNWYGYVKVDGAYDQNLTSHGNFAMWVQPKSFDDDDPQFNMTANATRFGVNVKDQSQNRFQVNGQIEFDLYAGINGGENKAMLQLRHAYFSVGNQQFKLVAGQTWDLFAPLNAPTQNYPVMWSAGNVGYRRPQVTFWLTPKAGTETQFNIVAGFFRTIGSDLTPSFSLALGETAEGADDGTDAAIPSVQGLFEVNHKFANNTKLRTGVSGLWGQLNAETTLGNSEEYESYGFSGHLSLDFNSNFGLLGEYHNGSNLGSYYGAVSNANRIDGLKSQGAFGAAWLKASSDVKLAAGYGYDDPEDADLSAGNRSKNTTAFANVTYYIVPQVALGLEGAWFETEYLGLDKADSYRVQTSFQLNF